MAQTEKPGGKRNRSHWLLGIIGLVSEMYAKSHESGAESEQKQANEKTIRRATTQTAIATIVIAIAGVLTFFAAVVQAIIFGKQSTALHRTDEAIRGQLAALIESERAFLIVGDMNFRYGDPTASPDGLNLVMIIKNVGKHVAIVKRLNVKPAFFTNPDRTKRELSDAPPYEGSIIDRVIPPIVQSDQTIINIQSLGVRPPADQRPDMARTEMIAGVLNGDFPMRVFGFIEYHIGFPQPRDGLTGYCFEYLPEKRRVGDHRFETCNHPNYTYTR